MKSAPLRFGRPGTALALLAASCALAGCASIRDHKGYVGDAVLLDSVQAGIDNKESVAKTLGRPSFVAQWDDSTWYYWARNTKQTAFGSPRPTDQLLMTVKFDRTGNVASVGKTGTETIASINPASGRTPTLGSHRGFFAELFGNIGTVGAAGQAASTADNPN